MNPLIETHRLKIRPWSYADIDHYLTLAKDVGYNSFSLPGQFALEPNEARERIKNRIDLFESKKVGKFLLLSKKLSQSSVGFERRVSAWLCHLLM